jgi:HlyD family secretion protein
VRLSSAEGAAPSRRRCWAQSQHSRRSRRTLAEAVTPYRRSHSHSTGAAAQHTTEAVEQVDQNRANLVRAESDVERLRVALQDAQTKLSRAEALGQRQLLPQSELDAAAVDVRSADAQVKSAEAQVAQARAALKQSEVNLENTVITAPIDGIVLSRDVDVGQTVAASMQAPTLFVLAADLTKMQVLASLDESDIGRIADGQKVTFTVDAYVGRTFEGVVSQIRLQPQTVQNVVTYSVVVDAPNHDLTLKPGMTANVTIEVASIRARSVP